MKILMVIDSLGTGGAEKSMVEYAKFLKRTGHNIIFICQDKRVISYEEEVRKYNIEIKFFKEKNFFKKIQELATYIKQLDPDIIHSVLVSSNILVRLSRNFIKRGKVIQSLVNTPYSLERKKDSKLSWKKFMLAKQLDVLTARLFPSFYHPITHTVLDHYKSLYKISDNYQVIYRGRNINKSLKNGIGKRFTIINVGRQEFAKGQIILLKAINHIEERYNIKDIYLKILGFEGKSSEILRNFVNENKLQERVEILGFVKNVEEELVNSSAFVFPSYYEGLGGALIEAFAAKLPCICSDIPVLKEVVGRENGALFCPPGDFKCFGEQIFKLYKDEAKQKTLGDYSYSRFHEKFRMEAINQEMLNMYLQLLKT